MHLRKKAVFNWSGGKDSALALHQVLQEQKLEVVSLLTTINKESLTSSIHAIPLALLKKQAHSLGIPLYTVELSKQDDNYEKGMAKAVNHFKKEGVTHFIFGDIFLEDVRSYREKKLMPLEIEVVEPLWGKSSKEVMEIFLQSGIKTKIILTQADKLGQEYIGKEINKDLVSAFPPEIDVCVENGEYHTFSYGGPLFKSEVFFQVTKAKHVTHEFTMDNGRKESYSYWQAEFSF